jgi:Ala-tRNA(Pro) deacylase
MQITDFLDQNRVDYQVFTHRPAYSSQHLAAEEHVSGMNVAKPVIVQADGEYYMCVLPACCKIDLEQLRLALNASEIHLADEQEMAELFPDCELGAEPPFGNLYGLRTLMDKSLRSDPYLLCQAGKHEQAIRIHLRDYQMLVQPQMIDFSYHLH